MVIIIYEVIIIKTKETSRVLYIDILRVISIFTVVVLHVSAPFVENMYSYGIRAWWIGNIIDSSTRWCVPILIMISGKLMLDTNKEIKVSYFLKKRLVKILIPLVFWSFIYMVWNYRYNLDWNLSFFVTFAKNLYEGNIYIHLWYLYMIVGLYLITPIIKVYINNVKNSNIIYFVVIWFISNGIIGFLEKFTELKISFNLSFFYWSIGFYVLGIFLDKEELSKTVVSILYILGFLGLIVTIGGTYIFTKNNDGNFIPHFYSYYAPNVIFMSVSIFLLSKKIDWDRIIVEDSFIYKLILNLSNVGFGIYLVHLLVLDIITTRAIGISINPYFYNPMVGILLLSVITFLLSYLVVFIIQKIPLLNRIIPR